MCRLESGKDWDFERSISLSRCEGVSYRLLPNKSTRSILRTFYHWTQVSRLGTGSFILMISTLIAASSAVTTIVTVSCTDINTLVDRAKVYPDLSVEDRQEVINLYYDFGEKYGLDCRDAKADWRNGNTDHSKELKV